MNLSRMTARFVRLVIASLFLLNALVSGALADAVDCGPIESSGVASEHADHASHDSADRSDEPADNVLHETLGCHNAGSGCPGCIAPFETTSAAPAGTRVAYPLSDLMGRSIELTDSFRPPITSL